MRHANTFFLVTGAIGLLFTVLASSKNRRAGRRVFWGGALLAAISAFFIAYPPDWKSGALLAMFASGMTVFTAYFYTPYIKIRGKIYAFHIDDSRPDPSSGASPAPANDEPSYDPAQDAYRALGGTTASKMWWLMIFAMALCVLGVAEYFHFRDSLWSAVSAAAVVVVVAALFGYAVDASPGYPIARGQYLQFAIVSVITAGVFTIFYLCGYFAGKRWPLHRAESSE